MSSYKKDLTSKQKFTTWSIFVTVFELNSNPKFKLQLYFECNSPAPGDLLLLQELIQ
jgi:hypothetical protein